MAFGYTRTLPTITGSHSDFPVLLTTGSFPTEAIDGGSSSILNGGGNLRAYTDDTKTTQLPVEIVTFVTGVTPDIQVWVKIPTAATGNTIYIEADDTETTQPPVTDPFGRNAVWSGYEVVYHFNSLSKTVDSTGNNDLTEFGTVNSVTGKIGDAIDSNNNYSNRLEAAGYKGVSGGLARTVTCWIKSALSSEAGITTWGSDGVGLRWTVRYDAGAIRTEITGSFSKYDGVADGANFNRVSSILSGSGFPSQFKHLVNGSEVAPTSEGSEVTVNTGTDSDLIVNASTGFSSADRGGDEMDEFSIRSFAINNDRDLTEYDNQNDPDNWGTSSAWEQLGPIEVNLSTGDYSLGGNNITVELTAEITVNLNSGGYSVSGNSIIVDLIPEITVNLQPGNYTISGNDLIVSQILDVPLATGNYILAGNNLTVEIGALLDVNLQSGGYALSGDNLTIELIGEIQANLQSGNYTISGNTLSFPTVGQQIGNVTAGFADNQIGVNYKQNDITVRFK